MTTPVLSDPCKSAPGMFATNGVEFIQDTTTHYVSFYYIVFTEDTVVSSSTLDSVLVTGGGVLAGKSFSKGQEFPMFGSDITLTSGGCILGKR